MRYEARDQGVKHGARGARIENSYSSGLGPHASGLILAVLLIFTPAIALAIEAQEQLPDKAEEARAVKIGESLRCVICPSGTVNDSPAGLAQDLRHLIRKEVKAGKNDAEIREYIRMRYGDYVLLKPPLNSSTLALWLGPFALLIMGLGAYIGFLFPKNILAQKLKSCIFSVKRNGKNS